MVFVWFSFDLVLLFVLCFFVVSFFFVCFFSLYLLSAAKVHNDDRCVMSLTMVAKTRFRAWQADWRWNPPTFPNDRPQLRGYVSREPPLQVPSTVQLTRPGHYRDTAMLAAAQMVATSVAVRVIVPAFLVLLFLRRTMLQQLLLLQLLRLSLRLVVRFFDI